MFLYPMGEEHTSPYPTKSAEVVDVDFISTNESVISTNNDLYKRITKQWIIAQEIAGLTLFTSCASWLFLVFRSIEWFPAVITLSILTLLGSALFFALSWNQLDTLGKIRLFTCGVATGFATAISGSDILFYWFISNQILAISISIAFVLFLFIFIGFLFKK